MSFLSLKLLSYMVVLIRDIGNITFSTSAITFKPIYMTSLLVSVAMDINDYNVNNYNDVRRWTISCSKANSRIVSISSSKASKPYHAKIKQLNNLTNKEFRDPINSSQLSYSNQREREIQVSRATDHKNRMRK